MACRRIYIGATMLECMDGIQQGHRSRPELIEWTGRSKRAIYGAIRLLLRRGLVYELHPFRPRSDGSGSFPAELSPVGRAEYRLRLRAGRVPGVPCGTNIASRSRAHKRWPWRRSKG